MAPQWEVGPLLETFSSWAAVGWIEGFRAYRVLRASRVFWVYRV